MQPGHEDMEDDREQIEHSEVFLDVDDGALVARIEVHPSVAGAEYAFYLQQDGKRVETRWYSSETHARFTTQPEAARYRAIGFVRRMGKADAQMITSVPLQRGTSQTGGWTVQRGELAEISEMLPAAGSARLDVTVPGSPFEYQCLLIRKRGNRLFVIFGGAVPERSKAVLPRFSRFTWAPDFPGPILCIADPTLLLGAQLRLGWYFGRADADATTGLAIVVEAFAKALGLGRSQIVTYGSSGGGFAAMQVAARIGEGATAIAINAQTNALDYAQEKTVEEFLSVCTGGMEKEAAQAHFGDRLSLVKVWQTPSSARARCLLLQNRCDHHHHDDHLLPFAAALGLPIPGTSTDG